MVSPVLPEPRTTRLKPTQDPKGKAPASAKGEPAPTAQGLSDEMLVQGLQRGFQEFQVSSDPCPLFHSSRCVLCVLTRYQLIHGPFSGLVDSPSSSTILEKFWTTFTYDYESTYLSPLSPLEISSGGVRAFTGTTSKRVQGALRELPIDDTMDNIGVISTTGSASLYPVDQALVGWLSKTLTSSLPPKPDSQPGQASPKVDEGRKSSWSTLGLSWVPSISSRSVTPSKLAPSFTLTGSGSGTSDGGIKPMLKARPSKQSMGGHSRGPSAGSLDSPGTPRLGTQLSPLNSSPAATGGSRDTVSKDDKWGFGLGGLTDAMGSLKAPGIDVANLFRFGTPPTPSTPDPDKLGDNPNDAEATNGDAHLSGAMSQTGGANEATVSLNDPPLSDPTTDPPISSPAADPPAANSADQKGDVRSSLEVEPRPGLLPELEAASTHVIDLGWISRVVYLRPNAAQEARTEEMAGEEPSEPSDSDAPTDGAAPDSDSPDRSPVLRELQKFTVSWIIRDTILLYLVSSTNTSLSSASSSKANPPTESVLELYAKLSSIFSLPTINTRSSSDHTRDTTTWVYSSSSMNIPSSSPMPRSSQDTLVSLKDWAAEDRAVDEVFGKTSSDFVALKRVDGSAPADGKPDRGFVALSLGRKDASLTDTDCESTLCSLKPREHG